MRQGMDMWYTVATFICIVPVSIGNFYNFSIFKKELIIFTSSSEITNLLVHVADKSKIHAETERPSVFFTLMDERFDEGSCIYILEDLAAFEILDGGRDSTAEYGSDRNVYFGSKDGVYRYDRETSSAKKFGLFSDDIIQLQKANGTDTIYYLTKEYRLFELENGGTVRNNVEFVVCASQFVLDTSNNLYYVKCKTQTIFILKRHSSIPMMITDNFLDIKLIRPAFMMDDCIPFLGDGTLHILFSNGSYILNILNLPDSPSAISVDAGFYVVVALKGNIYEYNVMEVLLKSMYGNGEPLPQNVNKIITSVLDSSKDVFGPASVIFELGTAD